MQEIDLQEATRRDDVYQSITKIVDEIGSLDVFPSLVWVYIWDCINDIFKNHQWKDVHENQWYDECIPDGLELKQIWDKLWETGPEVGFTMEYGTEQLFEHIQDWLRDNDFLVSLDPDSWLDEETNG